MKIRKEFFAIIFILIIASYLRLTDLELTDFRSDEARDWQVANKISKVEFFPLTGPSLSIGGNLGPFEYYLFSIPSFFSVHPITGSIFVVLLNIASVYILYKAGKDFFNEKVGLISALLLAVSSFAILFSRKIWNPDLVSFFFLIFLYSLLSFAVKKKKIFIIVAAVSLALLTQLHLTSVFLSISFLVVALSYKTKLSYFLIGLLLAALTLSPFLLFETTHNFQNINTFIQHSGKFSLISKINLEPIRYASNLASGKDFDYFLGSMSQEFYGKIIDLEFLFDAMSIVFFFSLIYLVSNILEIRKKKISKVSFECKKIILSIVFLSIIFPLLFYKSAVYLHYVIAILPLNFLILGIFIDWLLSKVQKLKYSQIFRVCILLFLLTFAIYQIYFILNFYSFLAEKGGTGGDYGITINHKIDAAKFISEQSSSRIVEVSNKVGSKELYIEYEYLLKFFGTNLGQSEKKYIIIDSIHEAVNEGELRVLEKFERNDFGPIKVYKEGS